MSWEQLPGSDLMKCRDIGQTAGGGRLGRFVLVGLLFSHLSYSQAFASSPESQTTIPQPRSLEESIWLADVDQLDHLEQAAARLVQQDPYSSFGHYLLAEMYLKQFKQSPSQLRLLKQASELGQQAIELNPKEDYGYIVSAQVLDLMGYTDNALDILEGDGRLPLRSSWRVDFLRGQLLSGQSSESQILKYFEAALKTKNSSPDIIIPYVIATLQNGSSGAPLIEELRAWMKNYPHRLFDLSLAIALSDNQQYDEAHKVYARLQKGSPETTEAFINDGILLYSQLKKPQDAQAMLAHTLQTRSDLDKSRKSLIRAHLARIQLEHFKNYPEARKLFGEAIGQSKSPMEWIAFSHKAYEKSGRLQDFVALLEDLRPTITGSSYLYALQGEILSESLALHDQAIESFSSAILLDPDRSEFYNGLGLTYYRMHQLDKALTVFHEASKLDPQDATARYNEACVLAILGRAKEALGSLKEAIVLDPRLQQTARLDKDFTSIRVMEQFQSLTHSSPETAGP